MEFDIHGCFLFYLAKQNKNMSSLCRTKKSLVLQSYGSVGWNTIAGHTFRIFNCAKFWKPRIPFHTLFCYVLLCIGPSSNIQFVFDRTWRKFRRYKHFWKRTISQGFLWTLFFWSAVDVCSATWTCVCLIGNNAGVKRQTGPEICCRLPVVTCTCLTCNSLARISFLCASSDALLLLLQWGHPFKINTGTI